LKFLKKDGQTLIQSALRFSLSYKAVSVVIPGAKTINQVEENISAAEAKLNPNELKRIRELYRNNFLP